MISPAVDVPMEFCSCWTCSFFFSSSREYMNADGGSSFTRGPVVDSREGGVCLMWLLLGRSVCSDVMDCLQSDVDNRSCVGLM